MDRPTRSAGAVAGLPDDPLVEILSRIPAKSVFRFRCVSKAWRDLIDDPLNRRKLPQTLEGFFVGLDPRRCDVFCVGHFDFINFKTRSVPLDVDRCFSFLTKLPEIESLFYEDSCNGLFLFQHYRKCQPFAILGYIVCNPATKHWGIVPPCACCLPSASRLDDRRTFLAFDPAVSSHFHLIQFWEPPVEDPLLTVQAYSSETGMWSHNQTASDEQGQLEGWHHEGTITCTNLNRVFVNGILHLIVSDVWQARMFAVDVQGKTKKMITMPAPAVAQGRRWYMIPYIGLSQGRLHYIIHDHDVHGSCYELSIWVLQDYDTQEWVLKHTVSFLMLFGRTVKRWAFDIVAIHPNCSVVFFRQPLNRLIAYDMDRKEVSVVASVGNGSHYMSIDPYVPNFSELPVLTNKH